MTVISAGSDNNMPNNDSDKRSGISFTCWKHNLGYIRQFLKNQRKKKMVLKFWQVGERDTCNLNARRCNRLQRLCTGMVKRGFEVWANPGDAKLRKSSYQKTNRNPGRSSTAQSIKFFKATKPMKGSSNRGVKSSGLTLLKTANLNRC